MAGYAGDRFNLRSASRRNLPRAGLVPLPLDAAYTDKAASRFEAETLLFAPFFKVFHALFYRHGKNSASTFYHHGWLQHPTILVKPRHG